MKDAELSSVRTKQQKAAVEGELRDLQAAARDAGLQRQRLEGSLSFNGPWAPRAQDRCAGQSLPKPHPPPHLLPSIAIAGTVAELSARIRDGEAKRAEVETTLLIERSVVHGPFQRVPSLVAPVD